MVMVVILSSCQHKKNEPTTTEIPATDTATVAPSFFPVTAYLEGQIVEIKNAHKKITAYHTANQQTDSILVAANQMDSIFSDFVMPNIDSTTLARYFKETKFEDQTLNAITLSYDAKEMLPDTILWQHWDIYIQPETNEVERIYLVKTLPNNTTLQLTWIPGSLCKKTYIAEGDATQKMMVSETTYQWK